MIELAEIFQDSMVLQRRKPIRIWGKSSCPQNVKIYVENICVLESEVSEGKFELALPAREAAEDIEMRIASDDGNEIVLNHIDIGEVWIAGGQSNMEFPLRYDKEGDHMAMTAGDRHFRFYDVGKYAWEGERELGLKDARYWDRWMEYEPDNAPYFSAVGVYFALELRRELGVPVAVIGCNWGGSTASAWLDERMIRGNDKLRVYADEFDREVAGVDMEKYMEGLKRPSGYDSNPKVAAEVEKRMKNEMLKRPGLLTSIVGKIIVLSAKRGPYDYSRPGGLYENMIKKIAGYTCSGFLWYQGESDYLKADIYDELLSCMISCWRAEWGEELPFLLVQLTSYLGWKECSGENYHIIRQQQQKVADQMKKVYLASAMDAGSKYDIHPKEKRVVGMRLAGLAFHYIYDMPVGCEAPRMVDAVRKDGEIIVSFDHVAGELFIRPSRQEPDKTDPLSDLFVVKSGNRKIAAKAQICGKKVRLIFKEKVSGDMAVSFAYRPYAPMTLFADNGLAARPCPPIKVRC